MNRLITFIGNGTDNQTENKLQKIRQKEQKMKPQKNQTYVRKNMQTQKYELNLSCYKFFYRIVS